MKKFKGDNFKRSVAKFGTSNLDDEALNSYASSWGLFWLKCLKGYALELSTVAYDLHMILVDFSTSISYQCIVYYSGGLLYPNFHIHAISAIDLACIVFSIEYFFHKGIHWMDTLYLGLYTLFFVL